MVGWGGGVGERGGEGGGVRTRLEGPIVATHHYRSGRVRGNRGGEGGGRVGGG